MQTEEKLVLRYRDRRVLRAANVMLCLWIFFLYLDVSCPRFQLSCTRHAIRRANKQGSDEDNDCTLSYMPTSARFHVLLPSELTESFEIKDVQLQQESAANS